MPSCLLTVSTQQTGSLGQFFVATSCNNWKTCLIGHLRLLARIVVDVLESPKNHQH